jgi:tetratricopeptide (TPR) repeat protein
MDDAKALVADADKLLGAATDPTNARWLDTQQSLLLRQMEIADWEERYDDVRVIGARSLAALDSWRGDMRLDDRYPVWRASVLSKLGASRWYLGDRQGSLQVFQSADALLREALVRMPNSTSLIKALIVNNYDVATTLDSLGQTRGAIPRMRESLAYGNRLLSFESRDQNLRRLMWRQQSALAQLLASIGKFRDALREETAVVAAKQAYRRDHPGEIRAERDLAFDTMILGTINWRAGRRAEACRSWTEAERQFLSLKQRGVLTPWDTSTQLGFLRNNLDVCARRKPASAIRLET